MQHQEQSFSLGDGCNDRMHDKGAALFYHPGNSIDDFLFSGALNHQTAHHLFPGVSQFYYPQITPIVRQACKEFGVRYNYKDTFTEALGAHIGHLKRLGQQQEKSARIKREEWSFRKMCVFRSTRWKRKCACGQDHRWFIRRKHSWSWLIEVKVRFL